MLNSPEEITKTHSEGIDRDVATKRVLIRDRICAMWCKYEPGLGPAENLREHRIATVEADRRKFEQALSNIQTHLNERDRKLNARLTWTAIVLGLEIGLVQVWAAAVSMGKDSIGIDFGKWVWAVTVKVARWLCAPFHL